MTINTRSLSQSLCRTLAIAILAIAPLCATADTWTNRQGQSMEATIVRANETTVTFRKTGDNSEYAYPLAELSDEGQKRVRAFIAKNPVKANEPAKPAAAASKPAAQNAVLSKLAKSLVVAKGSRLVPADKEALESTGYTAIYFSAGWCPPCRKFTPVLVDTYKQLKKIDPNFEIIFVSSDKNEEDYAAYIRDYKMPWPSVSYKDLKGAKAQLKEYSARGIPNLVFIDADGKVISASYVNDKYVGPNKVLKDIQTTLKKAKE